MFTSPRPANEQPFVLRLLARIRDRNRRSTNFDCDIRQALHAAQSGTVHNQEYLVCLRPQADRDADLPLLSVLSYR